MASRFYTKELFPNETEEERAKRVSMSASYGHLKRRLHAGEVLTGKPLELALELVTPDPQSEDSAFKKQCDDIVKKLNSGVVLDEYEVHLIIDVFMVHAQLG